MIHTLWLQSSTTVFTTRVTKIESPTLIVVDRIELSTCGPTHYKVWKSDTQCITIPFDLAVAESDTSPVPPKKSPWRDIEKQIEDLVHLREITASSFIAQELAAIIERLRIAIQ